MTIMQNGRVINPLNKQCVQMKAHYVRCHFFGGRGIQFGSTGTKHALIQNRTKQRRAEAFFSFISAIQQCVASHTNTDKYIRVNA